ncbi:restriction endonuclease subunit S [Fibrobacter sp. UWH6]|uniref:restriction endonuclease subunit S n=1 Tax=Fibrobacter sp. (strain UWH6) TaxID=1896212 RepID=UPI0009204A8E|nr:restriction endonuclease subunit S [Fibrobacter sp. UWH6]SHL36039.1 type I restriction enzyme, S subunit [Fibrobacter sp. UWH6]
MKQKWTCKTLAEVGTIVGGSTPKTNVAEFWDGKNYWVTPAELKGDKYINETERTITDMAVKCTNLTLLPVGTVLLSSRAPIGKVCITRTPMYCNQGFKNIICSEDLYNEYLYWWLKGKTAYLNSLGVGATFKEISKRTVEHIEVPVPPKDEQERIVAELDLLTGVIEKLKAQLQEYDKLAQSIFYDMFGDPIENPKGWDVKELGKVCDVRDGTHDSPDYVEQGYPLVTSKNVVDGDISFDNVNYICQEDFDNISKRSYVDDGDIIMPMIGTIGKPVIVRKTREFAIKNVALIKFKVDTEVVNLFVRAIMSSAAFDTYMKTKNKGGTQKFIALGDIRKLCIPVPPLALQQSFADKIASIEKQKAAITQSIAETQKLLDYTMDKYFG